MLLAKIESLEKENATYTDFMQKAAKEETAKNYSEAIALYERAGEVGSIIAYNNLSVIYAMGNEVPQDFKKAKIYLNITFASAKRFFASTNFIFLLFVWSPKDKSPAGVK